MVSNLNIERFQNTFELSSMLLMSTQHVNDTLHYDLNVPYVRNEIRKLSQKYVDRLEKHSNI